MQAWRIADARYWDDRVGTGAILCGGRWNNAGSAALYLSLSAATCALEVFAHVANCDAQKRILARFCLPDAPSLYWRPAIGELPQDWDQLPYSGASMDFGSRWLASRSQLGLIVPSVLMPETDNLLLNPNHPAMAGVSIERVRDFSFDPRFWKN